MILRHIWGLFVRPANEWAVIRDRNITAAKAFAYTLLLAAIPAICGFIGTTQHGWEVGAGVQMQLTTQSATVIAVLYYLVIIAAVYSVAWMIRWMGETYGATQSFTRCLVLAVFIPIPLFLAGFFQLYPLLWLNLIVGIPALSYTVFLLYTGIPVMMGIPQERGFLFASAVLAFGLIGLVGILVVTVLLWGIGIGPVFEF